MSSYIAINSLGETLPDKQLVMPGWVYPVDYEDQDQNSRLMLIGCMDDDIGTVVADCAMPDGIITSDDIDDWELRQLFIEEIIDGATCKVVGKAAMHFARAGTEHGPVSVLVTHLKSSIELNNQLANDPIRQS